VSLTCAASYFLEADAKQLLAREGQATNWTGLQADLARARAELAAITETSTAESLNASAAAAGGRVEALKDRKGKCTREECLKAQGRVAALLERAGKAKRKTELEATLASAKTEAKASGGPATVSGRAMTIAALTGGNAASIEKIINGLMAALKIVLLETLVYLSMPATALLRQAIAAGDAAGPELDQPRTIGKPQRAKRLTPAGTNVVPLNKSLLPMALRGMTQRQIAEATGLSKSTVQRRLAEERSVADRQQSAIA
jgi:uncharacterized protein YjhX (UPF0386 family)